jgi:hypothetical protein
MSELLPAEERIRILSGRLANLYAGKGQYGEAERRAEIKDAEDTLASALIDHASQLRAN